MSRIAFQKRQKEIKRAGEEMARNAENEVRAETGAFPASSEP